MAQGYYTLEEAAQLLGMSLDELKQLARKGEVRSFQDRGSWRFRVQDIQELSRRRGNSSEPELTLGESMRPQPADPTGPKSSAKTAGPKSSPQAGGPKSGAKPPAGGVFDFSLEAEGETADVGQVPTPPKGSSSQKNPTPTPTPGSDSDVRLVPDDDAFDFQLEVDSDVKMVDTPKPGARPPSKLSTGKTGMGGSPSGSKKQSKLAGVPSPRPSKLAGAPSPRPSKLAGAPSPRPSKLGPGKTGLGAGQPLDSGVRLVPMDSDSDVRIVPPEDSNEVALGQQPPPSATDSDIRLELREGAAGADEGMLTEEINLDEELRKQEAAQAQQPQSKIRPAPGSSHQLPTTSPFELNESQLRLPESSVQPPSKEDSSDFELTPAGDSSSPLEPGSSDLELTPAGASDSPLEGGASDEFSLELPDEGAEGAGDLKGPASGISLDKPLDSGISLEQGGDGSDEIEFSLNLEDEPTATPKPTPAAPAAPDDSSSDFELTLDADEGAGGESLTPDTSSEFELSLELDDEAKAAPEGGDPSSSEFELTLDSGDEAAPAAADDSDSEFELTLDSDEAPALSADDSDSEFELTLDSGEQPSPAAGDDNPDSEFELTLDDSGNLAGVEGEASSESDEKDIFETDSDFEVPTLDEESGSEAVALDDSDADLESSDFDIALDDQDATADEESGSQVVALDDEEEADDAAATVAARSRGRAAPELEEDESGFGDLADEIGAAVGEDIEEEAEEEEELVGATREAVAAPWGALPVVFMLPCVVVMFLVGIMGFELVQSMTSYKPPGMVTKALTDLVKGK